MKETLPGHSQTHLSLWDSICLIIGIIIGASIYQTPPEIFRSAPGPWEGMLAWGLGGLVSLLGALCYSELASTYRSAGGDYTFLTRAYGRGMGFFFAWAELAVIRTGGSIALMAFVFANYAQEFYSLGNHGKFIYAVLSILVLAWINATGVRPGRWIQNTLTTCNFVGLITLTGIGLYYWFAGSPDSRDTVAVAQVVSQVGQLAQPTAGWGTVVTAGEWVPPPWSVSFALTMVLVFYAYGGWNEAAFIASEMKRGRDVKKALILGTLLVTLLYLLVNLAYLGALGYVGVCQSKAIAADMASLAFGEHGRKIISLLVMVSALGSVHGLLFTGMRLYGTFGAEHKLFAWLGQNQPNRPAYGALFAQVVFSLLLLTVVECSHLWRSWIQSIGHAWQIQSWQRVNASAGIYELVTCTAPVFWLFFLLTSVSLFVLRVKEPDRKRPFRVPLYPFLPACFTASCAFMLYRSTVYALEQEPVEAFLVLGLMLLAFPLLILSNSRPSRD